MFGVKFPGHGRPVQSYSFQIFGSGRFQFLDEFIQFAVHGSLLLYAERISPASARAAASKRSSAKTSESTTPATSSTEATPAPRAPAVARPAHPPSAATAARTHESAEKKPKDEPQHREKEKNNKNEQPNDVRPVKRRSIRFRGRGRRAGKCVQRDSSIRGDNSGNPLCE